MSDNRICPICGTPFERTGEHLVYCSDECRRERQRRRQAAAAGYRETRGHRGGVSDGTTIWVVVEACPKDDDRDITPPFTSGSKFPLNQFADGLLVGDVWPEGMKVKVIAKKKGWKRELRYTIPEKVRQYGLCVRVREELREVK